MAQWLGFMVSIKSSDGTAFQGEISSATTSEITLSKAFSNGIPCPQGSVKIRASEIAELKLIDKQAAVPQQRSTITIAKPIAKRAARTQSTSEVMNSSMNKSHTNLNGSHAKSKPISIDAITKSTNNNTLNDSFNNSYKNGTPNVSKKDKNGKSKWTKGWKDEECFGSPLDSRINKDFDFEKNLALFDKQAIWDELNNAHKPDVIKNIDTKNRGKYRHDENVIASGPVMYRQIIIPKPEFCEYVTDDGLIIPSITRTLRRKLWDAADKFGLSWDKRVELLGRAATEISIQLLGGGHRFNPHNTHQFPTVVVLCGPHQPGAAGINTARQLASHGVHTILYTVATDSPIIKKELSLYKLTRNQAVTSPANLPNFADLIIVALGDETDSPKGYPALFEWIDRNRAPVLALDPPSVGTPGLSPKFSLLPVLPLPHTSRNGKLYLCNLGLPFEIFNEVGIKYKSPFGSKFVIPLHPRGD